MIYLIIYVSFTICKKWNIIFRIPKFWYHYLLRLQKYFRVHHYLNATYSITKKIVVLISLNSKFQNNIVLIWSPTHLVIKGNELVHNTATQAAAQPFINHAVSPLDFAKFIHKKIKNKWNCKRKVTAQKNYMKYE